jgi:hypothetical protein
VIGSLKESTIQCPHADWVDTGMFEEGDDEEEVKEEVEEAEDEEEEAYRYKFNGIFVH